MYIPFDKLITHLDYILEEDSLTRSIMKAEKQTSSNSFRRYRPQGIIIQDTFNNPIFPIPEPRIDSSKFILTKVIYQFRNKYSKFKIRYLPWHFVIEIVDGEYIVYNTRPIISLYPLTIKQFEENLQPNVFQNTRDMLETMKKSSMDVQQCIHVCIIGDTSTDVYTQTIYQLIGEHCIRPFMKLSKITPVLNSNIFCANTGDKFKFNLLKHYLVK